MSLRALRKKVDIILGIVKLPELHLPKILGIESIFGINYLTRTVLLEDLEKVYSFNPDKSKLTIRVQPTRRKSA